MSKLSYFFGESGKPRETITFQGIINDAKLYVNGLGWLTITFTFKGNKKKWMIYHLNEDPYQEILLWFLRKDSELGGRSEKIILSDDKETVSFDDGKTWDSIYECEEAIQNFKKKSITVKCTKFREKQEYLSEGSVSFDDGQTWFDIDSRKNELDEKWYANGGRIGFLSL